MSAHVSVSEDAAIRMAKIQQAQNWAGWGLRLGIKQSGCSGYSYQMDFEQAPSDQDHVFESFGVRVFVTPEDLPLLSGSVITWKDELMESGFVVDNPHATRPCGCGSSFDLVK